MQMNEGMGINTQGKKYAYIKAFVLVLLVLLADQCLKVWIKTHLYLGEEIPVFGNWFIIHFTENNGMAFGFEFAGRFGKLFLSVFRIAAVAGIGYGLVYSIRKNYHPLLTYCVALIFAGAIGNIIDSVFYGVIYGYEDYLHGRVVDMLYFPIVDTVLPEWVPFKGGEQFVFFSPVFNLADTAISLGVILILLFQKRIFPQGNKNEAPALNEQ